MHEADVWLVVVLVVVVVVVQVLLVVVVVFSLQTPIRMRHPLFRSHSPDEECVVRAVFRIVCRSFAS